jgi:transposase-like protein
MKTNIEAKALGNGSKGYTEEFKRSVVTHWLESGRSARKIAEEFGVKQWNLRDWRFRFGPAPKAPDDPQPETPEGMRTEIRRLRQELARVTTQREILKKSLGIISEV